MNILSIETTGATCGVAIATVVEARMTLVAVAEVYQEQVHDVRLSVMTQQALEAAQMKIEDVDIVAVSAGPGSFTGTRIGVSFAKGLTLNGAPRLLLVDTSEALAYAAAEVARHAGSKAIITVIPSHRGLYYQDRFIVGDTHPTRPAGSSGPELSEIEGIDSDDVTLAGPGAGDVSSSAISGLRRLSARFIALRASSQITESESPFHDPLTAEPMYRQKFVGRQQPDQPA